MPPAGPLRTLGSTVLLTVVATALVFAFDPVRQPWPGRYLDWLDALVRLDFLAGREDPAVALAVIRVPYAVMLTMAVACWAVLPAALIVFGGTARRGARPVRPGRLAAALATLALLGWSAGTFGSVAGWLSGIAGADVLPTTVMGLFPTTTEPVRFALAQAHQVVFPTLVVAVALVPGAVWWCRRAATGPPREATAAGMRALADVLPVFVAAAVLVELARNSFGAGQLLVGRNIGLWFEDTTSNIATAVLVLGLAVALTRCWLAAAASLVAVLPTAPEPPTVPADAEGVAADAEQAADETAVSEPVADEPVATKPAAVEPAAATNSAVTAVPPDAMSSTVAPESFGHLWRRVRADRAARVGLVLLAGVGLAVCYARLWFDVGPTDIVSTDAPRPPSAQHWLGVDTLGHDQLVRVAAATAGSGFVIAGAATVATLVGLLLTATRLPRRSAPAAATLAALTAIVWLLATFGDPSQSYADPGTRRLELAVALGVLAAPLTTRILSGHGTGPGPAVGAWLAACAAAVPAEQLATLLLVKLDHRSPTIGTELARTVAGSDPANLGFRITDPASDQPWLWYPPAVVLVSLAVATTLLAVTVLTHQGTDPPVRSF